MKLKVVYSTTGKERLKTGWLIRYDNDIYKVMVVDESRAYCVKLSSIAKKTFESKAEEISYSRSINSLSTISISANSQVDVFGVHRSNVDKEILKRRQQIGSK